MKLPAMRHLRRTRKTTAVFGGLDRRPVTAEGHWREMENMTGTGYPTVSVRQERGRVTLPGSGAITGVASALGVPVVTRGTSVVIGERVIDLGLTEGRKKIVTMGAYLLIFPDGKYVNTSSLSEGGTPDYGDIDAAVTLTSEGEDPNVSTLICSTCDEDGNAIVYSRSVTEPPSPENGSFWYDIGNRPAVLKQYKSDTGVWEEYVPCRKFSFDRGIELPFEEGETVFIDPVIIRTEGGTDGAVSRGNFRLIKKGDDYFVIPGGVINRIYDGFTVSIRRGIPEMDHVTEAGNRLWGCKYGVVDGKLVNEIYASALGDFRSFHIFENVSTDSYAASVGADGPFTGAATYRGNPVFFKERTAYRVYGSTPSSFRIQSLECDGVADGSENSLSTVGGYLYYVSPSGVMRYDGSAAENVSAVLGATCYGSASAGVYRGKYYVSMETDGPSGVFVFDPRRGTWHREDGKRAAAFCGTGSETYFFAEGDEALTSVGGSGDDIEGNIPWFVESGDLGLSSPSKKFVTRVTVRMRLGTGSSASFFIRYDGAGDFIPAATAEGVGIGSFSMAMPLRRCDSFRIRISGVGDAAIYSIALTSGEGSECD